jgi:hypothetical protein
MPLEDVERIATVPLRQVEYADGSAWLRHEGALLELEDAAGMLRDLTGSNPEPAKQQPAHQHIAHQHAEHQNTGQQETDPLDTQLTVLICARPGADHRTGLIVRRVLDVAAGLELPGRLTIVNDALTALHSVPLPRAAMPRELSCPPIAWQEVA